MTTVTDLIDEMDRQVPPSAAFGARWQGQARATAGRDAHLVVVAARIDPKGRRREHYLVDGTRVERAVLLRLTCPETDCPQARAVRAQWQAFHHQGPARQPVQPSGADGPVALMQEVPVVVGRHHCVARPQRFACFTPCPHHAHPPLMVDKTGYDLFEDGQYLGGGLTEASGVWRPRLPSPAAAEAYVLARHLEALVALDGARHGEGGPPAKP